MTSTADFFALGKTITLPGKDGQPDRTYTLRALDQEQQGHFSRWLEHRAHDAVDRSTDSEERKLRRHHLIDVDAGLGKYEYDGEYALEARWTPAGLAKAIAISCRDQGVTEEIASEILAHSLREVASELIGREEKDPKVMAVVRAVFGLTTAKKSSPESDTSASTSSPSAEPTEKSPSSPMNNSSAFTESLPTPTT